MDFTTVTVDGMTAAAQDLTDIGSRFDEAVSRVRSVTTNIETAANDEVSVTISSLFNSYGTEFHRAAEQVSLFHREFTDTLLSSTQTYTSAEASNAVALSSAGAAKDVTIVMGGTAIPYPPPDYVNALLRNFVIPYFPGFGTSNVIPLYTPEQLFPFTGWNTATLDESVNQGLSILNTEIMKQLSDGNNLTVVGYSQSSIIASLEMRHLQDMVNPPSASRLNFVLLGNPMNPNGGLSERLPGLNLGFMGFTLQGATPVDTIYHTDIYSAEYDPFADAPQYPVDILADLNAVAGTFYAHGQYMLVSPDQVADAIQLPTDPSYGTNIDYFILPAQNLPLLDPLLQVPIIGKPLVDLIQPDLRYLINWGFGNPYYGYSTGYANIPTTAGILPPLSDTLALPGALISGTQQGLTAFAMDVTQGLYGIPPAINAFAQQLPTYLNGFQNAVTGFTQTLPTDVSALTQTPIYPGTQTLP